MLTRFHYVLPRLKIHGVSPPAGCQQLVCLVSCAHFVVIPWLWLVFFCSVALWHTVGGGVAVGVVAAFFLLAGVEGFLWLTWVRRRRVQQQYPFRLSSSSG